MKHGKKYRESLKKYDPTKAYDVEKACELVKELKYAKFDETVEAHISLKLDKNQTVRDTLVFPYQFRGEKKVLVFCKEDRIKEAMDAGAAYAGADEYIEKVKGGWRKGLMPNPKTGTVTNDISAAIAELKKGRVEFRSDKGAVVHMSVGKVSMDCAQVAENVKTLLAEVVRKKPADAKGGYVRSVSVNSTMGPGVWVDYKEAE